MGETDWPANIDAFEATTRSMLALSGAPGAATGSGRRSVRGGRSRISTHISWESSGTCSGTRAMV
jgi:hypothetical protein